MRATFVCAQFYGGESNRFPDFGSLAGKLKPRRHHPDDGVAFPIEQDAPPYHRGVACETPLPQSIAQNDHLIVAWPIFLIEKCTAQYGLDIEQREQTSRGEG